MSLTDELIDVMESATLGEYDKRSAIGIADSFVRGGNSSTPDVRQNEDGSAKSRDGLAFMFIELIKSSTKDEQRLALRETRLYLNAPYMNDPVILKWRAEREAQGPLTIKDSK